MCRIFGFRSIIKSKVHQSLVNAENALQVQSHQHPDGWGLVYYVGESPHVVKSVASAYQDQIFPKVSGLVSSQTFLAHVRYSTQGSQTILDTHPFQYGAWVMAHNGNIRHFESLREKLCLEIQDDLRAFILGKTDSELIFYFLLSELSKEGVLESKNVQKVMGSLKKALQKLKELVGGVDQDSGNEGTYLTFVMSRGDLLIGFQGGKELMFSTYKTRCPERDNCPILAPVCEQEAQVGEEVKHLLFTSEPIEGFNVWQPMKLGEMIGVDETMILQKELCW